jgi:hypothetical protein
LVDSFSSSFLDLVSINLTPIARGGRLRLWYTIDEEPRQEDKRHHQPPRQIHLSRREICLTSGATPGFAKDGEPRLAAMQGLQSVASFARSVQGRIYSGLESK